MASHRLGRFFDLSSNSLCLRPREKAPRIYLGTPYDLVLSTALAVETLSRAEVPRRVYLPADPRHERSQPCVLVRPPSVLGPHIANAPLIVALQNGGSVGGSLGLPPAAPPTTVCGTCGGYGARGWIPPADVLRVAWIGLGLTKRRGAFASHTVSAVA